MADKKKPAEHSSGGGPWLGISVEILIGIALIATFVYGAGKPFTPTFLNLDYIFGKMLVAITWIINFSNGNNVGLGLKIGMGLVIVFLIGFDFYLLLRILEMEEEHVDHVYHHAVDDLYGNGKPKSLMNELISDVGEVAEDAKLLAERITATPATEALNRVLYMDDADLLDNDTSSPTPQSPLQQQPRPQPVPQRNNSSPADKEGSSKWRIIIKHINSKNSSDWKLSIIEADTILDGLVERAGFAGDTLGDRMKNADPGVFRSLRFAQEAHGIRNRIAHMGSDFILTERDARETIKKYEEVFREFDYI